MPDSPERRAGRDRRAEPRFRVKQPAMLLSKAAGTASVQVLDIGRFGLRVSIPFRLSLGDEVEIRLPDTTVLGVVRNCRCIRAIEFHVGIEIRHDDPSGETALDRSAILRKATILNRGLGIDRRAGR
jgi:PilZ domain